MAAIKTYTRIEKDNRQEFGYGLYVNAYVVDTDLAVPEAGIDGECGLYASECVPFDADDARISRARRRVRQNARRRYEREQEAF